MTYSASVLDNTTTYCFLELQVMAPTPIWNEYPEIECLCGCPAQSASQNPSRIMFPRPLKVSQRFFVFLRYVIILFTPSQILNELRQDPDCKCCIQAGDQYRPQETSSCLCIWNISHSKSLHRGLWALIFTERDSWFHQCIDSFCIGKSKIFDHSFNITPLVDRNGLSGSVSPYFKSREPSQFATISYLKMLSYLGF